MLFGNRNTNRLGVSFFFGVAAVLLTGPVAAATLHVILVGDTDADRIGRGVSLDLGRMSKLVKSVAHYTGLTLAPKTLSGDELTHGRGYKEVTQAISGLSVDSDDVILFYYSGHGTNEQDGSRWPSLAVEGNWNNLLKLDWVVAKLQQKNPRFFIAMADACNKGLTEETLNPMTAEKPEHYQKLFLGYQGSIVASSSKPGQYSWNNSLNGSLYTSAFLESLNEELASAEPDWNRLMERAQKPIPLRDIVQQPQSVVKVTFVGINDRGIEIEPPEEIPGALGTCNDNYYYPKGNQECCMEDSGHEICYYK